VLRWGTAVADIREAHLPLDVLSSADEVFITSSTRDVHPVVRVDDRAIEAGPVTARLAATFGSRARVEIDP